RGSIECPILRTATSLKKTSARTAHPVLFRNRCSILAQETAVSVRAHHVDVRARRDIVRIARAHFHIDGHSAGPVDQMMTIARVLGERRTFACAQNRLSIILDQRDLAFQHIDELVFVAVPVTLAGPAARRQRHEIDAEIAKPAGIAQTSARSRRTGLIERRRITRTLMHLHRGNIDLRHTLLYFCWPLASAAVQPSPTKRPPLT